MFSHRSFLMLGGGASDIMSLIKGGYEITTCNFSFDQGTNQKGKATTRVYSGIINLIMTQLPPNSIIEWALNARKYMDGMIVTLNDENIPLEKIIFKNATCVNLNVSYTQKGKGYTSTNITIAAEELTVGEGVSFTNEWIY